MRAFNLWISGPHFKETHGTTQRKEKRRGRRRKDKGRGRGRKKEGKREEEKRLKEEGEKWK